ncbi:hypothetical protein EYF80_014308 [Liparis tanakae]|uniref:Uncharacterized protein n=1 Tax=Liparis tanakae TaxID=230148 RepID=A0A4Z2IBX6_9TELE|nr:hypothetical protein EYF80_014308 [Liparis tanakae]
MECCRSEGAGYYPASIYSSQGWLDGGETAGFTTLFHLPAPLSAGLCFSDRIHSKSLLEAHSSMTGRGLTHRFQGKVGRTRQRAGAGAGSGMRRAPTRVSGLSFISKRRQMASFGARTILSISQAPRAPLPTGVSLGEQSAALACLPPDRPRHRLHANCRGVASMRRPCADPSGVDVETCDTGTPLTPRTTRITRRADKTHADLNPRSPYFLPFNQSNSNLLHQPRSGEDPEVLSSVCQCLHHHHLLNLLHLLHLPTLSAPR